MSDNEFIIKLVLPGSIRSKKNSKKIVPIGAKSGKSSWYFRKNGNMRSILPMIQPSDAYVKWENDARKAIKGQFPGHWRLVLDEVWVKALIYYKGPQPDLSGAHESIGDCLEGFVWENDKQIKSWDGTRLIHSLENPRTEVSIYYFDENQKQESMKFFDKTRKIINLDRGLNFLDFEFYE